MAGEYTQNDLLAIKQLIKAGAGKVTIAGKSVEYRNLSDLLRIQSLIESDLNVLSGRRRKRVYRIIAEKGL